MAIKKSHDLAAWSHRIRALSSVHSLLRSWQKSHGRHGLPWQVCDAHGFRDPYRVWLSEIMLQQTQVTTVIAYFNRFIEKFPTIFDLARATQDEVFAQWSGLGYYRRARFLHECAQAIVQRHGGVFPRDVASLVALPGIGKTTASAIASFCFGANVSIFDGNVERLTSRLFAFNADLSSQTHRNTLWALAETLLPSSASAMPWHTQGLMDLGATVCKPKQALCGECPLSSVCLAKLDRTVQPEAFPFKTKKIKRGEQESVWLWLECNERVWLEPRPMSGVWGGLWSLPILDADTARDFIDRNKLLVLAGKPFKHVLTHRDWTFYPMTADLCAAEALAIQEDSVLGAGRWISKDGWMDLGVSGPTKVKLACWQGEGMKKRLETSP